MSQAARDHLEPIINKIEQTSPKPALQAALSMDTALAIMQFMLVAKEHGYDTGAMTGFDHDHIVSALDLDADRYAPVMLIAVGKATGQLSASYREAASQITTFKWLLAEYDWLPSLAGHVIKLRIRPDLTFYRTWTHAGIVFFGSVLTF